MAGKQTTGGPRPALVVSTGYDEYQRQLVRGAVTVLAPRGLTLVVNSFNDSEEGLPRAVAHLIGTASPYGVLATVSSSAREEAELTALLRELRLPTVRIGADVAAATSVRGDSRPGMEALMRHLLDGYGVRRPVFVRGLRHQPDAAEREQMFRQALVDRGLPVDEELFIDGYFWHEPAYRSLRALLRCRRDMDAVVAANDLSALGALKALADEGIRVPEQVMVTGFDNDPTALSWPELTTVDPDLRAQGVAAAEQLLALVDGEPSAQVVLPSRLVVRGSTRPPDPTGPGRLRAAERAAQTAHEQLAVRDALWSLSHGLSYCSSLAEVASRLAKSHLMRLGISRCFLAVYEDQPSTAGDVEDPRRWVRLILNYRDAAAGPVPEALFPLGQLLPGALAQELRTGVLVFQPLAVGDRELGYILLEQAHGSSLVSDSLRMFLSRTLEALFNTQALMQHAQDLRGAVLEMEKEAAERRRVEAQLKLSSTAFDQAADGIVIIDARARVMSMNPAFTALTGYRPEELIGQPISRIRPRHQGTGTYRALGHALRQQGHWEGEMASRRKDGAEFVARVSVSAVGAPGFGAGQYVLTCNDVTELRQKDEYIQRLAFHDELTGLPNRALLTDRLNQGIVLAQREGHSLGVVFVDLDRFKVFNESYGWDVGNGLLREVAARLSDFVRQSDTVARIGPDEFVVISLQQNGPEETAAAARRIIAEVSLPATVDGYILRASASVGVATFPDDGVDATNLIKKAESAMHSAKSGGGANYRFFQPEMTAHTQRLLQLENELRDAVVDGGLELFYQPKVSLLDGSLQGAEALVRWRHPVRGLVPPLDFIPLAEERGIMGDLGTWVLDEACRQVGAWQRTCGHTVKTSVNISAVQTRQRDLAKDVLSACGQHGISPGDIELELTESGIMDNLLLVSPTFSALRDVGVTIAVDDFGTGYSGFAYLRDLPVDVLKIDRSFVMNLETKRQDRDILTAIVTLGLALNLDIVAEGVETPYQAEMLTDLGCRTAQGYLFARPMPPQQFEETLLSD